MYRSSYYTRPSIGFGRPWTPMVRILILINGAVFLAELATGNLLISFFGLDTSHPFHLWRYVTYLFLHDPRNVFNIFFNMLLIIRNTAYKLIATIDNIQTIKRKRLK